MMIKRMPSVDELDRDGERLVLMPDHAVHLVGMAPPILDLTHEWTNLDQLVDALLAELGEAPPGVDATAMVRVAVHDLAEQGLVELSDNAV